MQLTVGFYCGLARRLSKETTVEVSVGEDATLRDVAAALAKKFPAFLEQLIVPETYALVRPHFFSINGRHAASLDLTVSENDRILLMAITAGG